MVINICVYVRVKLYCHCGIEFYEFYKNVKYRNFLIYQEFLNLVANLGMEVMNKMQNFS